MNRYLKQLKEMGVIIEDGEGASKPLAEANNYLAVNLHHLIAEEKGNAIFSPLCISAVMAMLLCAAEGETEYEMRAVLGYDLAGIKREDVAQFEQQISSLLQNSQCYSLLCASSLLTRKGLGLDDGYRKVVTQSFGALVMELEFDKENEKAVKCVNEWAKDKTKGKVPNLVQSLDPEAVIVLLNAVYFKGMWGIKFDRELTHPQAFYNKGKKERVKQVDMMRARRDFYFFQSENWKALRLPYLGEKVSMLILLPRERDGLDSVEAELASSCLRDITSGLCGHEVDLTLPKFSIEHTEYLIPHFRRLGMRRVFSRRAELGLASYSSEILVSQVMQRAALEVNEDGTEAASVCVTTFVPLSSNYSPPPSETFTVDHPFLFFIYDIRNDLILFMGRVVEL